MIHHLSIAAHDPKHAADVLAEMMGGTAVPFPPNPGSFFALQLDDHGSGVEVYPADTVLQPNGDVGGTFAKRDGLNGYGSTHFALSVATYATTVKSIAKREGWNCFDCNRGPFHVIEVWVENESDGRDPAARIRARIPRLHPPGQVCRRAVERAAPNRPAPPDGVTCGSARAAVPRDRPITAMQRASLWGALTESASRTAAWYLRLMSSMST